jgi:drug/metabolite transporter (DMT)-like permease
MPAHSSSTRFAYAALAAAGCLWGTGFLAGKIALRELNVAHMVLYRLSFASLGLLPVAILRGVRVRRQDWPALVIAAFLGVPVLFLVQFEGLDRTTVAHASLMIAAAPMLLALGASLFAGERLDGRGRAAVIASTAGAALIALAAPASGSQGATLAGDLLVIASLIAATAWVLLSQRLMRRYTSGVVSCSVMMLGTLMLAAWVVAVHGRPPARLATATWLALASQGLLSTTCATLLWNWGVARVPASRAGVFVNLEPVIGAFLGVTVLGETLGTLALAGGLLIVGAAISISRR